MKTYITKEGTLIIEPENETEFYALKQWQKEARFLNTILLETKERIIKNPE